MVSSPLYAYDVYMPFAGPYVVEDAPQSSEDGSGLHSPTFMDSEATQDNHPRGDFRAPPPDLDVRNVAGLLASHFSSPNSPAYASTPFGQATADSSLSYSPSYIPAHPREYDDETRGYYASSGSRAGRGHYGAHPAVRPPSPSYIVGGMPSSGIVETPRPLAIPSLLPNGGSTSERGYLTSEADSMSHPNVPPSIDPSSPISPQEGASSSGASARPTSQASGSLSNAARREPSMVVIACRQCRSRKIRCDSNRPACNNCIRRQNECQYDAVPKRRGPDKRPGTRQRSCKKRPVDGSAPAKKKQKKGQEPDDEPLSAGDSARQSSSASRSPGLEMALHPPHGGPPMGLDVKPPMSLKLDMNFMHRSSHPQSAYIDDIASGHSSVYHYHSHAPSTATSPATALSLHTPMPRTATPLTSPHPSLLKQSPQLRRGPFSLYDGPSTEMFSESDMRTRTFPRQLELSTPRSEERLYLSPSQNVDLSNKMWWENLLTHYGSTREASEAALMKDLSFLFGNSIHWLSFLNDHHFFRKLMDITEREKIQPALVLSALALAKLLQSSELGEGERGRMHALTLLNAAQASLEAAWSAGAVNSSLAQAAMLIAIFESSAHPAHTGERASASLFYLDQIIRTLALTQVDINDPHVSNFANQSVPSISQSFGRDIMFEDHCYCAPPVHSPHLDLGRMSPTWASSIRWDASWTAEEIEREETRRLCWAALSLAAAHTAHCAAFHNEPLDLFLCRPENYALLFPGEKSASAVVDREGMFTSPKQSIWALYCRSMLLWNSCLRLRKFTSDNEKAEFAMEAWREAQDIQDALESHSCATDPHLTHLTREHLFNTRIALSYEFRRLQDIDQLGSRTFNRRQATEWLYFQNHTAKRFEIILHDDRDPQSQILARRPFYVWWFMSQLAISMSLWVHDNTLVQALDLCKTFLVPLDILSALWPCKAQRGRYFELRDELAEHCEKAGLPRPPPVDFSLPVSLR